MTAEVLRPSPALVRRALEACDFRIAEAVWFQNGTLRLYFGSMMPVSPWVLATLPSLWLLDGERVEAQYEDVFPCLASNRVTAFAEYKTAVHPSAPLILKETSTREDPNVIALVAR